MHIVGGSGAHYRGQESIIGEVSVTETAQVEPKVDECNPMPTAQACWLPPPQRPRSSWAAWGAAARARVLRPRRAA